MAMKMIILLSLLACNVVAETAGSTITSEVPGNSGRNLQGEGPGENHNQENMEYNHLAQTSSPTITGQPSITATPSEIPTKLPTPGPTLDPTKTPTEAPTTKAPTLTPTTTFAGVIDNAQTMVENGRSSLVNNPKTSAGIGFFLLAFLAVVAALMVGAFVRRRRKSLTDRTFRGTSNDDIGWNDDPNESIVVGPSGVEMVQSTRYGSTKTIMEIPTGDGLSTDYIVMKGENC